MNIKSSHLFIFIILLLGEGLFLSLSQLSTIGYGSLILLLAVVWRDLVWKKTSSAYLECNFIKAKVKMALFFGALIDAKRLFPDPSNSQSDEKKIFFYPQNIIPVVLVYVALAIALAYGLERKSMSIVNRSAFCYILYGAVYIYLGFKRDLSVLLFLGLAAHLFHGVDVIAGHEFLECSWLVLLFLGFAQNREQIYIQDAKKICEFLPPSLALSLFVATVFFLFHHPEKPTGANAGQPAPVKNSSANRTNASGGGDSPLIKQFAQNLAQRLATTGKQSKPMAGQPDKRELDYLASKPGPKMPKKLNLHWPQGSDREFSLQEFDAQQLEKFNQALSSDDPTEVASLLQQVSGDFSIEITQEKIAELSQRMTHDRNFSEGIKQAIDQQSQQTELNSSQRELQLNGGLGQARLNINANPAISTQDSASSNNGGTVIGTSNRGNLQSTIDTPNVGTEENSQAQAQALKLETEKWEIRLEKMSELLKSLAIAVIIGYLVYYFYRREANKRKTLDTKPQPGLSPAAKNRIKELFSQLSLQKLNPSDEVLKTYYCIEQLLREAQIGRPECLPPEHFSSELQNDQKVYAMPYAQISSLFCKVFYGKFGPDSKDIKIMRDAVSQLKSNFGLS